MPSSTIGPIARVVFINRFFFPDQSATSQMLSQLAFGLAGKGFDVRVVTSRQKYENAGAGLPRSEDIRNVRVDRVWSTRFGRAGLAGRASDYLSFCFATAWHVITAIKQGDIIVAKTDPPLLSVIVWPLAKIKGARFVNWVQDLFPEAAHALAMGSGAAKPLFAVLRLLRNRSLKFASANVVIGSLMAEKVAAAGIGRENIHIIHNWADPLVIAPVDPARNALRRAWGLVDAFVVAYSGNLGRAHEYDTILGAIERLENLSRGENRDAPLARRIRFVMIGGGALFEPMRAAAIAKGFTNVQFQPYQAEEKLSESLGAGDVHLISLRPQLEGLIVPSKFYGIAAAGRPSIFIGDKDGEIGQLIAKHGCGYSVAAGDRQSLADRIIGLARDPLYAQQQGAAARALFEHKFTREIATGAWANLLRDIVRDGTAH